MSKKKHKKFSRDMQFQRYAAQFWQELEVALRIEGISMRRYGYKKAREVAEPLLAKRLYDFASHCTDSVKFTFVRDVSDLTHDDM
jgi:hypothetical protein